MLEEILRLIYLSKATYTVDRDELIAMTRGFSERNARIGVTGTLIRLGNYFLQVLEGPPDEVDALYEKIKLDPRHEAVTVLARYLDYSRVFGDWGMRSADLESRYYVNLEAAAALRSHIETLLRRSPVKPQAMLTALATIQQHIRSRNSIDRGQVAV